jgi:hypothetical protein
LGEQGNVAQPTDESRASTLPDPELNPLLNPLLAVNMGRWAEVYFTSPPERRAQAVADLLQELANPPHPKEPIANPVENSVPPQQIHSPDVLLHRSLESVEEESTTVCESCGEKNSQSQRFCGMCGAPLTAFTGNSWVSPPEPEPPSEAEWDEPESAVHGMMGQAQVHSEDDLEEGRLEEGRYEEIRDRGEARSNEPSWRTDQSGWSSLEPREGANTVGSDGLFSFEATPARRNYRRYIAAGVAILLAALVFMKWHGNALIGDSGAATSELPPGPPPVAKSTPTPAQRPASAAPLPVTEDDSNAAKNPDPVPPAPRKQPRLAAQNVDAAVVTPHAPAPAATPASVQGNGNDDLATAEKYLNGGPGRARDSAQGATWLWRAVAKQNLTATLLLSDLYLRGDGVTKSCDQARLLLDAAARKGATPAAERLRHLPEFGCQ